MHNWRRPLDRLYRRATRRPYEIVSLRDDITATRRWRTAVSLRRYALWCIHWWARYRDALSLCRVWQFWFKLFWFYRANRQTNRMRMIAILTRPPSASVIIIILEAVTRHWCKLMPATRLPSICFALCDPVTLSFDLSNPKPYQFYDIPRSFPISSLNILGLFNFESCCGQTDTHTDAAKRFTSATVVGISNNVFFSYILMVSQPRTVHH